MTIKTISIKNFRGILDSKPVEFGNLTTLVGKNDSGKSCVAVALSYFLTNQKLDSNDFYKGRALGDAIEMIIEFQDDNIKNIISAYLKSENQKDIGIEEQTGFILREDETLLVKKVWSDPEKLPNIFIGILDFTEAKYQNLVEQKSKDLDSHIKELEIEIPPDSPGRNSDLEKIKFIRERLMQDGLIMSMTWKQDKNIDQILPSFEWFRSDYPIETDTSFNTGLKSETVEIFKTDAKEFVDSTTTIVKKRLATEADQIKNYMQHHIGDLEEVSMEPELNWPDALKKVQVSLKFSTDNYSIPLENKGSGYRRLFMVGRFRYLATKKPKNAIFAIEEPETFLHPSAQQDLLESLIEISETSQIILTTHSPIFAGNTLQNNIILCKKQNGILEYQQQKDNDSVVKEIIEQLGIKPGHNLIDTFEKIIFMESQNDIDFLCVAAQKLSSIDLKNPKYLFLPGGGDSLNNFIEIEYFSKAQRPLVLIIDGDMFEASEYSAGQCKAFTRQLDHNNEVCEKFTKMGGTSNPLKKRCIENYYHPRAIERVLGISDKLIPYDLLPDTMDVPKYLKDFRQTNGITTNLEFKNNFNIFNEMTTDEWEEVSNGELQTVITLITD